MSTKNSSLFGKAIKASHNAWLNRRMQTKKVCGFIIPIVNPIMTDIEIARALGKQVAASEALYCPLCSDPLPNTPEGRQLMSSFGDFEEKLFCPHCGLSVRLAVAKD